MKTQNKNRKLARNKPNKQNQLYRIGIPRNNFSYAPDSIEVELVYNDPSISRNNAGFNYMFWTIRMNSVFDPDPLLLSGAVSGFKEWSQFYNRYLVTEITIDSELVNRDSFPVGLNAAPSDLDIGSLISSAAAAQNVGETPYAIGSKMLSPTGGLDRIKYRKTVDLAKFTGQVGPYIDSLAYSALVVTNPGILLYWNHALFASSNFVNGIVQNTKYKFRVLFTQRNALLA